MSTKVCTGCHEEKSLDQFHRKRTSPDGLLTRCRSCRSRYSREIWYPNNRTKQKASTALWKKKNPIRVLARRYSVTEEEVRYILEIADNKCQICQTSDDLVMDHCHTTGKLRGLLCRPCNILLGH
jgi:hypothetical protein